jgi:hypothetical protein
MPDPNLPPHSRTSPIPSQTTIIPALGLHHEALHRCRPDRQAHSRPRPDQRANSLSRPGDEAWLSPHLCPNHGLRYRHHHRASACPGEPPKPRPTGLPLWFPVDSIRGGAFVGPAGRLPELAQLKVDIRSKLHKLKSNGTLRSYVQSVRILYVPY